MPSILKETVSFALRFLETKMFVIFIKFPLESSQVMVESMFVIAPQL